MKPYRSKVETHVMGLLYIVTVKLFNKLSREQIKHRILLIGCEEADIERKLKWLFDPAVHSSMTVISAEKVRDKVHYLSTSITQEASTPVSVKREEGSQPIVEHPPTVVVDHELTPAKPMAIVVASTVFARDEEHALRKLGSALINHANPGSKSGGPQLSEGTQIVIEPVALKSGFAMTRSVENESNLAHFVRG